MKRRITNIISKSTGYNWQYCSLGGVTRVKIASGEDIAHLGELDRKMWSVLSCPVTGMEFDSRTLQILDLDSDGKIRVDEVIEASRWLTSVLTDMDQLMTRNASVALDTINAETDEGKAVLQACKHVLDTLQRASQQIALSDVEDFSKLIADRASAVAATAVEAPFDNIDGVVSALDAECRDKVADFFMRCKFLHFDSECLEALDVNKERVATMAAGNMAAGTGEIGSLPLARPTVQCMLPLDSLNPVWTPRFQALAPAIQKLFPGAEALAEEQWSQLLKVVDDYKAAVEASKKSAADTAAEMSKSDSAALMLCERLLLLRRDFYTFIKNYVFFKDFYETGDDSPKALFQAGRLFIDQRCCELCLKVDNVDAHAASAALSGMFLIYCTCTAKKTGATMNIVAVLTDGDIDNLRVGKNAIFYDRNGNDWDAVVVKLIDNPISIRQAFWSPYRKFWNWCTEKLNKSAADKENKNFEDFTSKANMATTDLAQKSKKSDKETSKEVEKKSAFDIAKFAGIFAAIGMAVGYISSALVGLTKTIGDNPLNLLILVLGIILVVSGPSMFIAWSKLKKRNLGPLLNASGWAVNVVILVNVRFGTALTSVASYPTLVFDDPFAEKKMPKWQKILIWTGIIIVGVAVAVGIIFFLPRIGEILPSLPAIDSLPTVDSLPVAA